MNDFSIFKLLNKPNIKKIINIFDKESLEIRLVGGCVRDAFLNRESKDIDCAINTEPENTIKILEKNSIKYDDYAKKYGSISAFIDQQQFEITSLREDINQVGRHTEVIYTKDWSIDANRRDFTFNSLYLKSDGKIIDYFEGIKDLKEGRVKFIGNIDERIHEDFLRIFRYYRFLGIFEKVKLVEDYEKILVRYCEESFNYLSNGLIHQEILKMLNTSFPTNCFFNRKNSMKRKNWIELVTRHFVKSSYEIGLKKCLNKIDLLVN